MRRIFVLNTTYVPVVRHGQFVGLSLPIQTEVDDLGIWLGSEINNLRLWRHFDGIFFRGLQLQGRVKDSLCLLPILEDNVD